MPTKTIYSMWAIMAVILLFCYIATRKMKDVPGPLQNIAEMAVSGLLGFFSGVLGEKKARHYFPMLASFFVLIIVCILLLVSPVVMPLIKKAKAKK